MNAATYLPMTAHSFPFAVRLLGFSPQEIEVFAATFAVKQQGHGYQQLHDDNLQDPDLYIVQASNLKALVMLQQLHASDVRPALLVGEPPVDLPYARIAKPIRWHRLYEALDRLIEKRADALSRLEASSIVTVPERRRSNRVDIDLTDPAEYLKMRTKRSQGKTILIVDPSTALYEHMTTMLSHYQVKILWADRASTVEQLCAQHPVAVVIVNTVEKQIDAAAVCNTVRAVSPVERIAVIFMSAHETSFDLKRAREADYDGFLSMPVTRPHLIGALQRFMHLPR